MEQHLITLNDFCVYHRAEQNFITSLHDAGLVEVTVIDKTKYIPESQLQRLERILRLHDDLEINLPGIEAIFHLLERMEQLQHDRQHLLNRLRNYETD
jgi:hypothetical protein